MKKKTLSLHDKAVRLCEGGVVEFQGHFIRAGEYYGDGNPCYECNMDSICSNGMVELCAECDEVTDSKHILILANKRK